MLTTLSILSLDQGKLHRAKHGCTAGDPADGGETCAGDAAMPPRRTAAGEWFGGPILARLLSLAATRNPGQARASTARTAAS